MTVYATAGATLEIGGVLEQKSGDFVLADFSSITWVAVKELEALGSLGDTSQAITFASIEDKRERTIKGTRNAGTMEVVMGIDYNDGGQLALIAAEKTIHDYAFRVTFNDAPAGGTPSQRLFIAKVMSQSEQLDSANNVMKLTASLAVNSNVVRVAADEA
jgi:hypothetical protein